MKILLLSYEPKELAQFLTDDLVKRYVRESFFILFNLLYVKYNKDVKTHFPNVAVPPSSKEAISYFNEFDKFEFILKLFDSLCEEYLFRFEKESPFHAYLNYFGYAAVHKNFGTGSPRPLATTLPYVFRAFGKRSRFPCELPLKYYLNQEGKPANSIKEIDMLVSCRKYFFEEIIELPEATEDINSLFTKRKAPQWVSEEINELMG